MDDDDDLVPVVVVLSDDVSRACSADVFKDSCAAKVAALLRRRSSSAGDVLTDPAPPDIGDDLRAGASGVEAADDVSKACWPARRADTLVRFSTRSDLT